MTTTAAVFFTTFNRCSQQTAAVFDDDLATLQRSIIRNVPAAAHLAAQLADGSLSGEPLVRAFLPLASAIERLVETAGPMEKRLWQARRDADMPPLPFMAEAQGTSATVALVHVARRVVLAVHDVVFGWVFDADRDEGDDPLHENDVLAWGLVADQLREIFKSSFAFPDPAPLLHDMRSELMQLDGAAHGMIVHAADGGEGAGAAAAAEGLDDPNYVPMKSAASTKTRRKGGKQQAGPDPDEEPLPSPSPQPWPVYIVPNPNEPAEPAESPKSDGPSTVIVSHGEGVYSVGDAAPVKVDDGENATLQCFIKTPAMDKTSLLSRSGYPHAARALKGLLTKYGGLFAAAIRCPGKKGAGGYHVNVTLSDKARAPIARQ